MITNRKHSMKLAEQWKIGLAFSEKEFSNWSISNASRNFGGKRSTKGACKSGRRVEGRGEKFSKNFKISIKITISRQIFSIFHNFELKLTIFENLLEFIAIIWPKFRKLRSPSVGGSEVLAPNLANLSQIRPIIKVNRQPFRKFS